MTNLNRRSFIKKSIKVTVAINGAFTAGNLLAFSGIQELPYKGVSAIIPMPIQVVIDDVGWWSGVDGSKWQEPYRTGINRNHVVADYQAIVGLGKALGIRPQAAIILGEWDKHNILRNVPHSTWMGQNWDNSKWVGSWLEEASDVIIGNKKHFEITIHGLGHEWWTKGKLTRAEWSNNEGIMRQKEDVERHLDAFAEIMRQNNLGDFPKSFVPTAFRHGFGVTPGNKESLAKLLSKRGVAYINTPFGIMLNKENVKHGAFGFDDNVMTVDRGVDLIAWNTLGGNPEGLVNGSTCGMHWPNILHENPERNSEIVNRWVKFLAPYNNKQETMLAKHSVEFQHQLAHSVCTKTKLMGNTIELDFSEIDKLPEAFGKKELTIKLKSSNELSFKSDSIKIVSNSLIRNDNSVLYTICLKRTTGHIKASLIISQKL